MQEVVNSIEADWPAEPAGETVDVLISFAEIAIKYLSYKGYEPYLCKTEDEARDLIKTMPEKGKWPCLFTKSNTTGEKDFEEFYTDKEVLDFNRFKNIGIIKNQLVFDYQKLDEFSKTIVELKNKKVLSKDDLVNLFHQMIPEFGHKETGIDLDSKM